MPLGLVLAACSDDVVDLGGGQQPLEGDVEVGALCADSGIARGNFVIASPEGMALLAGCHEIQGSLYIDVRAGDLSALRELRLVEDTLSVGLVGFDSLSFSESGLALLGEEPPLEASEDTEQPPAWRLRSLAGLESLERVGALDLSSLAVSDLTALRSLRKIDRDLQIRDTSLVRLSGLESAELGGLLIIGNPELASLEGLALTPDSEVETVILSDNPNLNDIDALRPLRFVRSWVSLVGLAIENLDALSALISVDALTIADNPRLVDARGLDGLTAVGSMTFSGNSRLTRLPSFLQLMSVEELSVEGNAELEEFLLVMPAYAERNSGTGTIGRSAKLYTRPLETIQITGNAKLRRVVISQQVPQIADMAVFDNAALEQLDLGAVVSMNILSITSNPSLTSVLAPGMEVIGELEVANNPSLSLAPFAGVRTFVSNLSGNADELAP